MVRLIVNAEPAGRTMVGAGLHAPGAVAGHAPPVVVTPEAAIAEPQNAHIGTAEPSDSNAEARCAVRLTVGPAGVCATAVEDDTAYLRMGGGCQGCGMAKTTMSQGIEVAIKEAVPEILRVVDVTDHAGGSNPYYQAAKK